MSIEQDFRQQDLSRQDVRRRDLRQQDVSQQDFRRHTVADGQVGGVPATTAVDLADRERDLAARMREVDEIKTNLVSMVSHELRTPLAAIVGHLELITAGDAGTVDDQTRPSLTAIERNVARLSGLVEGLLLLSRVERRSLRAVGPVDLADTARHVVDECAERAARQQIVLVLDVGDDCRVTGDPEELSQAVSNLLTNAIEFSPAGSRVGLSVHRRPVPGGDGGSTAPVTVVVTDQGIGIPAADRDRVFEQFYRVNDPRAAAVSGTGLGLAVSHLVVQRHGGTIEVEPQPGGGSRFTATLPQAS